MLWAVHMAPDVIPGGGTISTGESVDFSTDFGGRQRAVPQVVHRSPRAFPSLVLSSGRPVTIRGAGLSLNGQTVTDGELLVMDDPENARTQLRDLGDGAVEVPTGLRWNQLEAYLNSVGRSAPVLTTCLQSTVGGTLSVGGFGTGSVRSGSQMDHVERIQLTDGTGASRWCSRSEYPELFRIALGGLGTAGLIERAVLRTQPHRPYSHVHPLRHATLSDLVEHTEQVAERDDVDTFSGMLRRGILRSTIGWTEDPGNCRGDRCWTIRSRSNLLAGQLADLFRSAPDRVRMWADYGLPPGSLAAMVGSLQRRLPLDRYPLMLYFLVVRRSEQAIHFAFAPTGNLPVSVGFGVYLDVPSDPPTIRAVRNLFADLQHQCCELGGRPYLYGIHDLDPVSARRLYGDDMARLAQLRAEYRLEHVNANLPLVQAIG